MRPRISPRGPDLLAFKKAQEMVSRTRGLASKRMCHHCSNQAKSWVLEGHPTDRKVPTAQGFARVNDDPMNYLPLCPPCKATHLKEHAA